MSRTATAIGIDLFGLQCALRHIRAEASGGLPGFHLEGLSEHVANEVRVRVKSAIAALGVGPEVWSQTVAVTFSPRVPTTSSGFDLPIAIAVLGAFGIVAPESLADTAFVGALGLSGLTQSTRGVLPRVRGVRDAGITRVIIPASNEAEGGIVDGVDVRVARTLADVVSSLEEDGDALPSALRVPPSADAHDTRDIAELPEAWKPTCRALELAAVGGHHVLFVGTSGAARPFLARCLLGILPPLSADDALMVMEVQSASGLGTRVGRPLRIPHHSVSEGGLVGSGGGAAGVYFGEVTLADRGVLLLDELSEFRRSALEALGRAVNDGAVTLRSDGRTTILPAAPLLIGAMRPCPCGFLDRRSNGCRCTTDDRKRYWERVPFAGTFDVRATLPPPEAFAGGGEASAAVASRVATAREFRRARELDEVRCPSTALAHTDDAAELLALSEAIYDLSPRAKNRLLRVARTIADLEASPTIAGEHVEEAIVFCRQPWSSDFNAY